MNLVKEVYRLTSTFPDTERFGLISQMQRCSVSIPSNIAEGAGRISDKEFKNFLSISLGSAFELETQILLSVRLGFTEIEKVKLILVELESICKMIHALKKRISDGSKV